MSNGQNRVHPESRWPKPGTPFHTSPSAPSYWPTPAQTRLWPNFKRVHPNLATHPPSATPFQSHLPDYGRTIRPAAHTRTRTRRRVIALSRDAAGHFCGRRGRACGRTLTSLCSLYVMYVCRRYICRCMHVHELCTSYSTAVSHTPHVCISTTDFIKSDSLHARR